MLDICQTFLYWFPFQLLAQTSIRAFEHSGFILRLILEDTKIIFEPSIEDFEIVLLNLYDVMVKASGVVPRVETKLYSEWVGVCVIGYLYKATSTTVLLCDRDLFYCH